jgi:hypothetical protein
MVRWHTVADLRSAHIDVMTTPTGIGRPFSRDSCSF